jgi:hypothetical protein
MPSTAPTLACHDVASYRSPINNFTCSDHQGTNCTAWRFVGLNVDELEDLVDSCPISCGIDCGSFERFEIKVPFRIIDVPTFLDQASADTLEEASVEYLTKYVETRKPASKFFLYGAELTAQVIQVSLGADEPTRRRLRRTQEEEPQYVDLLVKVAFRGFAIGLVTDDITFLILQGIDSDGYSRVIQRSGDPTFLDVDVTSNVVDDAGASQNSKNNKGGGDGPSQGGTAAAVIISFSLLAVSVGVFIKKRRTTTKGRSLSNVNTQEKSIDTPPFDSPVESPLIGTPLVGSVFSFEGTTDVVAGLIRIMSSGSPRSNDSSAPSGKTSKESKPTSSNESPSSEEEEEHPYTGIIPPMIVIDNIDESQSPQQSPRSREGGSRNVVPSQRLHASSELVAALNGAGGTSNFFDPSAFQGELFTQHEYTEPAAVRSPTTPRRRSRSFSPEHFFNRLWEAVDAEDGSLGQTITSANTKEELDGLDDLHQSTHGAGGNVSPTQANSGSIMITTGPASRSFSPVSNRSKDSTIRQPSPPRSPTSPSRGNDNVNTSAAERERTLSEASTVMHGHHRVRSVELSIPDKTRDYGGHAQSFWNRSPSKPSMPKISSRTSLDGAAASSDKNSSSQHSRQGSKESLSSGENDGDAIRHTFWAPRKGKLGLVIECSTGGPVVVQVKDYSPLLGQVLPGDKIAKVDGVATLHMNMSEVNSLLNGGGKSSYLRGPVIQFVVLRWPDKNVNDTSHIPDAGGGSFENSYENLTLSAGSISQDVSFSDMYTS